MCYFLVTNIYISFTLLVQPEAKQQDRKLPLRV